MLAGLSHFISMKYVALLSASALSRARTAIDGHGSIVAVPSYTELTRRLERIPNEWILLDPSLLTTAGQRA